MSTSNINTTSDNNSIEDITLLFERAKAHQSSSRPEEALEIYRHILALQLDQNNNVVDNNISTKKIRLNMGICCAQQGLHEEAVDQFHDAMDGHEDVETSSTMALFQRDVQRIGGAGGDCEEHVHDHEDEHKYQMKNDYEHVGTCWNGIAMSMAALGEYASASSAFETALEQFGTDEYSVHAVTIMENLGTLNAMCNEEDKALQYFEDALKMHDSNDNDSDNDNNAAPTLMGASLNFHVGKMHQIKNNLSQAIAYYNKTRDIIDASSDNDEALLPVAAQTLYNLAVIYAEADELENALVMHTDALACKEKLFGEIHPEVAESLNCIGAVQGAKGDRGEALKTFRKALRVYRLADVDEEHEDLVCVKRNIALIESSSVQ